LKNAILKLETDAGITGWGDAAAVGGCLPAPSRPMSAALHVYLRPLLIGCRSPSHRGAG